MSWLPLCRQHLNKIIKKQFLHLVGCYPKNNKKKKHGNKHNSFELVEVEKEDIKKSIGLVTKAFVDVVHGSQMLLYTK